ncbi:MAG TPA: prolipoprotein diacylglyceryl transferase [Chromatiales bacterium]|nr:prolipoprotein diacylglyceryl transferase [Thiotrichales bacterium]HIP68116.1 prolipoprotein diacylglyceryl transferase [Chromatiales bacterium]
MLTYPDFDPVALQLGPLKVHWYGVMYLIGFVGGWWLGKIRAKKPGSGWDPAEIGDMVFYIALGVVIGGRLGYVLFYGFNNFLSDPLSLLRVWEGGMSFHGGLLGVLFAMWLYGRKTSRTFFQVTDFMAPLVTVGLGAGRLGNFINAELWGKVTDLPWGMVFPGAGDLPRHPSMLYQAFLEGLLLFLILWWFSAKPRPVRAVSGLFLLCYGIFRFLVEFVRVPDSHIGYLAFDWLTMGQLLSLPMIVFGVLLLFLAYRFQSNSTAQKT